MSKNKAVTVPKYPYWLLLAILLIFVALLSTGCLPQRAEILQRPAGFFRGIWHGWLAPLSLLIGLFDKKTTIYQVYNVGWWYDFGYYMAVIGGFGGITLSRSRSKKKKED